MAQEEEGHLPEEAHARAVLLEMQERIASGPHAALGIPLHATTADIRAAFLQLTKKFHPARFGRMPVAVQKLSTEVFLALRGAHDQLAKQSKRGSGMLPAVTPVTPPLPANQGRATSQMPPLARPPSAQPVVSRTPTDQAVPPPQPPSRPTPQMISRSGVQPQPLPSPRPPQPPPPAPRRTPTASPPPTGRERTTPAMGVRMVPPAKPAGGAPQPPSRRADSSASMPALDRDLQPVYDLMQRGHWDQARSAIGVLAARDKAEPTKYEALLHYTRGREAQLERRLDEARVELDSALQLDPNLQIAKTALAELFTRRR